MSTRSGDIQRRTWSSRKRDRKVSSERSAKKGKVLTDSDKSKEVCNVNRCDDTDHSAVSQHTRLTSQIHSSPHPSPSPVFGPTTVTPTFTKTSKQWFADSFQTRPCNSNTLDSFVPSNNKLLSVNSKISRTVSDKDPLLYKKAGVCELSNYSSTPKKNTVSRNEACSKAKEMGVIENGATEKSGVYTCLTTPKCKTRIQEVCFSPGLNQSDDDLAAALDVVETHFSDTVKPCIPTKNIPVSPKNTTGGADHHLSRNKQVQHCMQDASSKTVPRGQLANVPQTPTHSLADQLKRKLQANAKRVTPKTSRSQVVKDEQIRHALGYADEVANDTGFQFDSGPFYGLPSKVQTLLKDLRGISTVYDWQDECLSLQPVREGRNLIYSLPTSGGKTLVAEILILKELLCKKKDAILILPFVSIVQEKVRNLVEFASELDFLVEEYAASKGVFPPKKKLKRKTLYIATIEKACGLVNSLIEDDRITSLGLVVVDELHMLGEGGRRGAILEETLTKLKIVNSNAQIVGMSATLSNMSELQLFLNAELYTNDFRPVELKEFIKLEDTLYLVNSKALCPDDLLKHNRTTTFPYSKALSKSDPDHIIGLISEVIPEHSCLLFCPTKKNCENVATMICKNMPRHLTSIKKPERQAVVKQLLEEGNGEICNTLRRTILFGVAYHHSGLTADERKIIEEAYSSGVLCLLTCTSTLAAGVNLPAKRVILRAAYIGANFMSRSQYKQMTGRAGRAGIDTSGESVLIVKKSDREKVQDLISGPCDSCVSSLYYETGKGIRQLLVSCIGLKGGQHAWYYETGKGIRQLLLSCIGLKIAETMSAVTTFMSSTLLAVQSSQLNLDVPTITQDAVQTLVELDLVARSQQDNSDSLQVTELGRATFKGSVDVDLAPRLYQDLCQAQQSLVVANYLHLLYLVTPYDMAKQIQPNWMIYCQQISKFESDELKVCHLIGVPESLIVRKAGGQRVRQDYCETSVHRFYLTLVLYELWQQQTIWQVSDHFQLPRGFIQSLLTSAATFASCVAHFCQEMSEFWAYNDLMASFVKKLSYCVTAELIPLMEIPGVKQGRARQLYKAGYKSIKLIAHAQPDDIAKVLLVPKKVANQIVISSKLLIKEMAETLREEADSIAALPQAPTVVTMETTEEEDGSQMSLGGFGNSQITDSQDMFL